MAQATAQIGVTGLGVMGRNLARNFARHGYTVALHNRTTSRTTAMVDQFGHEGNFVPAQTAEEFVASLERPRRVLIMVNAGPATDAVIDEFAPLLEDGDMIIDGGNAHFGDTRRREAKLREQNLHFVGMGVSGGEEALHHALLGRQQSLHCGWHQHVRDPDGKVLHAVVIRLPHGHGVGWRSGFETHGEEHNLLVRIRFGQLERIERRVNDADVRALSLRVEQAHRRPGNAQHVSEGAEDRVRTF